MQKMFPDSKQLKPFGADKLLFIFSILIGLLRKGVGILAKAWSVHLKTMDK